LAKRITNRPPPTPQPLQQAPAIRGLWIVCTPCIERAGTVLPLRDGCDVVIGRDEQATYPIDDEWLSRSHVRVFQTTESGEPAFIVEDLETSNGSRINGEPLRRRALNVGDTLRIGGTLFCYGAGVTPAADLGLVGLSEPLHRVREQILRLEGGVTVAYVTGESGSGKELAARAIHAVSRRKGPRLTINMATIVPGLAESQLFGHRKGSFSGAGADQQGALDAANGGTLVLDEVAEMAPELQAKLLRAVQFGECHRVGDPAPHRVDVQIIATTHKDLAALVDLGKFREDLYWRLAGNELHMPPIRDRRLDIGPLLEHFLLEASAPTIADVVRRDRQIAWHAADLLERALLHDWPGNAREVRDEAWHLARMIKLRESATPGVPLPPVADAFSARFHRAKPKLRAGAAAAGQLGMDAAEVELLMGDKQALRRAIANRTGGNVRRFAELAARVLGARPDSVRRRIYRRLGSS